MWKLGNIEVDGKVVLGPMAGFTSFGYRNFFERFKVALTYTEMISDMGLIYGNKETMSYLPQETSPVPIGVQLFGSEPENILKAAKIAKNNAKQIDFFDINMGCPVPKVTKTGAGSALLKDPKKCGEIIRVLKSNFDIPITAKIRMGWDDKSLNFLEVIKELEEAGVDMICIHARTKKDLYSGTPRFNELKDLRKRMNVPLVISGNIFTLDDAINAINITGADAVMIARGALGNPSLAREVDGYYRFNIRYNEPSVQDQVGWCLRLAQELIREKGEDKAMLVYRSIAPKFFSNLPNVKQIKTRLANELKTYDDLKSIILDYLRTNLPDVKIEIWGLFKRDGTNDEHKTMIRGEHTPEGYYHIVTDIVVQHEDGDFLLMQRDYRKHKGGQFELTCGGSAVNDESAFDAAKRELKEETGIDTDKLTLLDHEIDDSKKGFYYEYYLKDNIDKNSITLQEGETISYKWVNKDELKRMLNDKKISNKRILKYVADLLK